MTKLLTLYSPNSCNSFFFLTPLPTTLTRPSPHLSQVSVPAVLQRWPVALGELGFQHGGSPTASPPPGKHHPARQRARLAINGLALFFVHHGTRGLFACLPRKTHPRTPDKLTIQTLNWFLTETINRGGGERPLQSERTCYFTRSTSMFYSLTLSICLLCSNLKDGGCAAQPRVWLESTLFTEGQSSKPEAWLAFFCYHF